MIYLMWFSLAFIGTTIVTIILCNIAWRYNIIDDPKKNPGRKKQAKATPLLGGWAIYLIVAGLLIWLLPDLTAGYLLPKHIIGILLAGLVIMLGGTLDDIFSLAPRWQVIFPIIASIIVVAAGIGPNYITNPFGAVWRLDGWKLTLFTWQYLPYQLTVLADIFTISWLMVTMYTTKLLDGLDGLVPGVTFIGSVIMFFLSISPTVQQPETGLLALVFAGAAAGFLIWNFSPAKIYLGEGGALLAGFMLGILAILSGGKIATALLILGLPMLDLAWVVIRRVWIEHKSPFSGDALHLHYQLRLLGWSDQMIAGMYYLITIIFGLSTLLFTGLAKLILLLLLGVISGIGLYLVYHKTKSLKHI
ncbi:MAG: MraY family glycosyltransferase [Patescibacteria group bacterium]|jgi:UDP-GlcNAc:undecaprenyl-phosphate GlcNAc-1-phosphate transferase